MKTIWKCQMPFTALGEIGTFTINLPPARALSVGIQSVGIPGDARAIPVIWLEVDVEQGERPHRFYLAGTGKLVPNEPARFIGTYQLDWFVGHLYQLGEAG